MRFCTLVSGSSGNALYLEEGDTRLLIDIGLSLRELTRRLAELGQKPASLTGLLLTHEHGDHVKGLAQFAARTGVPIYGSRETLIALCAKLGTVMPDRFTAFTGPGPFRLGGLSVTPFAVPHDVPCLGYRIEGESATFALATDIGCVTDAIRAGLRGADFVLVESNHDVEMLMGGPYPAHLKRRILSQEGHLSNEDCGALCCELLERGTRHFVLGHLSASNNLPRLAIAAVCGALLERGARPGEVTVDVAPRFETGPLFEFSRTAHPAAAGEGRGR
ncbi:MAG: MBL fold metallo-hydrolase [Clostridia bacterium]|nr:MBL fold metallo-hydrolase [Clostridia bacterium]